MCFPAAVGLICKMSTAHTENAAPPDSAPAFRFRRSCTQMSPILCRPEEAKHLPISIAEAPLPRLRKVLVRHAANPRESAAKRAKPPKKPPADAERKETAETPAAERAKDKSRYITPKYSIAARMAKPHAIPARCISDCFESAELRGYARGIERYLAEALDVRATPLTAETLTDYVFKQCVCACDDAIDRGTFSIDYPRHCLNRIAREAEFAVQPQCHGLALVSGDRVLAWIFTDANGGIANFRGTLAAIHRSARRKPENVTPFMRSLTELVPNFRDFIHVKVVVTGAAHRGRGYAKILMLYALMYWADRAKPQAFLNMALEKTPVAGTRRVALHQSAASKRLYEQFDFRDAYPKLTKSGESRFSENEGHHGRLMVNVDVVATVRRIARAYGFQQSQ